VEKPEMEVNVMADGRRMWRIFDNLMNNICKYAKEGTRVYLSLTKCGDEAVICFKNTSRAQLNISAEELMERFVRGEQSRTTEGNGLGLSIAQSLTELQNGKMKIAIDGDLFKVMITFPCQ
jgi:signal transduction histidine kinase